MSRVPWCALFPVLLAAGCGTGIPPEEPPPIRNTPVVEGCASTGRALEFPITTATGGTVFWASDPNNLSMSDPKVKLLFEVPRQDQLVTTEPVVRISVGPETGVLPEGEHVDTVFNLRPVNSAIVGFIGNTQTPLSLRIRYDPVQCEIAPEIESQLVLGRLNPSRQWQEVCGAKADVAAREVSCDQGDLSFGIFGVIRGGVRLADPDPPFFPPKLAESLSVNAECRGCTPSTVEFRWGAAEDGDGSGVKGYWLYVKEPGSLTEIRFFTSEIFSNPILYPLQSSGTIDINQPHIYSVSAVDNAENESERFGNLLYP